MDCGRCASRFALRADMDGHLSCAVCGHVEYNADAYGGRESETAALTEWRTLDKRSPARRAADYEKGEERERKARARRAFRKWASLNRPPESRVVDLATPDRESRERRMAMINGG